MTRTATNVSQNRKSSATKIDNAVTAALTSGFQFIDPHKVKMNPLNFRDPQLRIEDRKRLAESFRASVKSAIADKLSPEIHFEPIWLNVRPDGNWFVIRGNTRVDAYHHELTEAERGTMFPKGFPAIVYIGLSEAEEIALIPDQEEPGQRKYNAYEKWHGYALLRSAGKSRKQASFVLGMSMDPNKVAPMAQRYEELMYLPKALHELFRDSQRPATKDEKGNVVWTPPAFITWKQVTELYDIQKRFRDADKLRVQDDEAPEYTEKLAEFLGKKETLGLKPLTPKEADKLAATVGKSTPYHACSWLTLMVARGNVKQSVLTDCLRDPSLFDVDKLNALIEASKAQ